MRKAQKFVADLKKGDVLATGVTVESVTEGYGYIVTYTDGEATRYRENVSVELMEETNCLYGGNRSGHSRGFCTADACY